MDIPPAAPAPPPVYGVQGLERKTPPPGPEATAARPRRVAVLVAHGMGQQIPYQTLDQVAEGNLQAVIVDKLALDSYERTKPGWFTSLKIVQESESFPATVVGYMEGSVDEAILKRLREGLVKAHQTRTGKQVLGMCRISCFEEIPADYEQALSKILKTYPAPENPSK